ncbi:MAG: polysaccharide deacetylase family protein [Candidatus Thorarchaeota archaeon]
MIQYFLIISITLIVSFPVLNINSENIETFVGDNHLEEGRKTTTSWEAPYVTPFYQNANTTFTLSWDDVRIWDTYLAPIDEKYGIKHTIFAPSFRSYPNRSSWRYAFLLDELFQGHDIQSHGGEHVHLSYYNNSEQERLVKWGKTGIEDLFGFTPIVFAYPYGDTGGYSYVEAYFDLGRTISYEGTSWPPSTWHLAGTSTSTDGIDNGNLGSISSIMNQIYRKPGYNVFKGYGHTNSAGKSYGVTDWIGYENIISQISGWENVWYTSWGELVAYTLERSQIVISDPIYYTNRITFNVSAPTLDENIYKAPLTIHIDIPKGWLTPFPRIDGKYSSLFSLRDHGDRFDLLLDMVPKQTAQNITVWDTLPELDNKSPTISNFDLKTRTFNQSWNLEPSELLNFTFMRFEVNDELTNIFRVYASVYLDNGTVWNYTNIKNPTFWQNSSYGRVVWNPNIINYGVPQINQNDVKFTVVTAIDGFGNTKTSKQFRNGTIVEQDKIGNGILQKFGDKTKIPHFLSELKLTFPTGGEILNDTQIVNWTPVTDSWGHKAYFNVSISSNGGNSWQLIRTNLTTPSMIWDTRGSSDGSNYLVKIDALCSDGYSATVQSDLFTVQNQIHFLSVPNILSPSESEIMNGIVFLSWTASADIQGHTVDYVVQYSRDQGVSWIQLVAGITGTSYKWNTSSIPDGISYLIRVRARCSKGILSEGLAFGPVSLRNSPHYLSIPAIRSPGVGQVYEGVVNIRWTKVSDPWFLWDHQIHYEVYYSSNFGRRWKLIENNLLGTEYKWNTTSMWRDGYLVKVNAICTDGATNFSVSGLFFIQQPKHKFIKLEEYQETNSVIMAALFTIAVITVLESYHSKRKS